MSMQKFKIKALERARSKALMAFRREVQKSSWKGDSSRIVGSFTCEVVRGNLVFSSDHPAVSHMNWGVKRHKMTYFKPDTPIPIMTTEGKLIFRMPASTTNSQGQWVHPGFRGKHFIRRGREAAQKVVRDEFVESYKSYVKQQFQKMLKR